MHWTLWTMLISIILLVIEFLIFKCFRVSDYTNRDWEDVDFQVYVIVIFGVIAFIPIANCIGVVVYPIAIMCNLSENYRYMELKPIEGNENNVMLKILHFMSKSI